MKITSIKNGHDYQAALARIEQIFEAKKNTPEGYEVETLGTLIDNYENENFPIDFSNETNVQK